MSNAKGGASDFGRDEFNALLGGGLSERLVRPVGGASSSTGVANSKKDVSDLTVEETAALLLEEQKKKGATLHGKNAQRHRAMPAASNQQSKRKYHVLLEEEIQKQQTHARDDKEEQPPVALERIGSDEDENENDFITARSRPRVKAAPVVLESSTRRWNDSNASSSDDDSSANSAVNTHGRQGHRRVNSGSSSSSSDDSARDKRRARLVQQRQLKQEAVVVETSSRHANAPVDEEPHNVVVESKVDERGVGSMASDDIVQEQRPSKDSGRPKDSRGKESSDGSKSEETSSSEDSESSSSDEDEKQPVRPVFVPKHKRGLAATIEAEEKELESQTQKQIEVDVRRKQESRAMVHQIVTSARQKGDTDGAAQLMGLLIPIDGAIPDDTDVENDTVARDEWQVRELVRLLDDWDLERERAEEERERARRRRMTDTERLQEDGDSMARNNQRQQQSSQQRQGQRFYHRGAFFMDESEWDETDVRQKVTEYAHAATGEDRRDRRQLPKVMQVKKFGFANQSKYKGLAAEDTTDKSMEMLPLQRKK